MSDMTVNLKMPYILPSQAQKHVTHNEALQLLDAVVQLTIADERAEPPGTAENGACFLIAAAASGEWSGKTGKLAVRQDDAWIFIEPKDGWRAAFAASGRIKLLFEGEWIEPPLPETGTFSRLGINATADAANRLAVSSPASLFNHEGSGHQIKINKAGSADTASLLFQTNWSGHAEMGLAGNDEFAIKVSPDGSAWNVALAISPQGHVATPNRPAVRAGMATGTLTPANGSETGFTTLAANRGGFALGEPVTGGTGNVLLVPATGLYLLGLHAAASASSGHELEVIRNSTSLVSLRLPSSASPLTAGCTTLIEFHEGDRLTLKHTGSAALEFGYGKTGLIALMV